MNRYRSTALCFVLALGIALATPNVAHADTYAEVQGAAHAKGFVLLKVSFPAHGEVSGVSLRISLDGNSFKMSQAGLPRHYRLLHSVAYEGDRTTVIVTVVGRFSMHDATFLFDEPGTYWLRWGVNFKNKDAERIELDQTVEVKPARRADLDFIARLSDPEFFRRLWGQEFVDRQTGSARERITAPSGANYRWSMVIRKLLRATTSVEPLEAQHKSVEAYRRWTDTMFDLANEFPESSYAPYAAFYAGGGYVTYLCEDGEWKNARPEAAREHGLFKKANEALRFVIEHGDSYLAPRAICQQARLQMRVGAFDEAEALLAKAQRGMGAEGSVGVLVTALRQQIEITKKREALRRDGSEQ